jgi:hypothetical protein
MASLTVIILLSNMLKISKIKPKIKKDPKNKSCEGK